MLNASGILTEAEIKIIEMIESIELAKKNGDDLKKWAKSCLDLELSDSDIEKLSLVSLVSGISPKGICSLFLSDVKKLKKAGT